MVATSMDKDRLLGGCHQKIHLWINENSKIPVFKLG